MTMLKYCLPTVCGALVVFNFSTLALAQTFPQGISVTPDGDTGNAQSFGASINGNGRYVAFRSASSDLVPGDVNVSSSLFAVFVRDLATGITERISVPHDGGTSVFFSGSQEIPHLSADGRYVVFASDANNLVPHDTNGVFAVHGDIFVRDRVLGITERINRTFSGGQVTQANADHAFPSISADGRYIAYASNTANLVPGDTNSTHDVFVFDRIASTTERASVASDGSQSNGSSQLTAMSADGRYVVFLSLASNLVPNDTNGAVDVFVRDRVNSTTERVSVASDGSQSSGSGTSFNFAISISPDGRYVGFESFASNLVLDDTNGTVDTFIHDRVTQTTERVSIAFDGSQSIGGGSPGLQPAPATGVNGRYVAFESHADNLVPDDMMNGFSDVFVRDRDTGLVKRISISSFGVPGNDESGTGLDSPTISADGRYVTFSSWATNLVADDSNGKVDVFVALNPFLVTITTSTLSQGVVGAQYNESLEAAGGTEPYAWSLSGDSLPPGLSLGAIGELSGAPTEAGLYEFAVQVTDSDTVTDVRTLRILIVESNSEPTLTPIGNKIVDEGKLLEFTVTATDPDDELTFSTANLPAGATFDPETATFSWTPTFEQAGEYPDIAFTVTDDGDPALSDSETIIITALNVPPLELTTTADSFLRNGNPDRNEGANPHLHIQSSGKNRTLVAFDEAAITDYVTEHSITSATLILTIVENGDNWGSEGRTVDVHPLLTTFAEGNGKNAGVPASESTRGEGAGVTWNCATDTTIENQATDCNPQWNGGTYATATAAPVLHTNNLTGIVTWDITEDVLNGSFSWLIKKTNEGQNGKVEYYSKEGAAASGNMLLAPRLILVP